MSAVPPRIPGSQVLSTLEVDTVKMTTLLGDILHTINTWKGAVTVASTATITTLAGLLTIDGVVLVSGDTVLVKDQSSAINNGMYVASAGPWYRTANLPTGASAAGMAVFVNEGTLNKDKVFVCTNDAPTDVVGTDALVFASFVAGGLVIANKADVTQITLPTTGVTVNGASGTITTVASTATTGATAAFVVTNSYVLATSNVFLQLRSYTGGALLTNGIPMFTVTNIAAGSFTITVTNVGLNAFTAAVFAIEYLVV